MFGSPPDTACTEEDKTTDPFNAIVSSAATRGPATMRGAELAVCALVLDVEAAEAAVFEVVVEGLVGRLVALILSLVLGPEVASP